MDNRQIPLGRKKSTMLKKVQIRNYKSIASAVVDLERLTVLVGPNGAGKSNFVDALSFVADSLTNSLEWAFKNRGNIGAVRRRSGGHPTNISVGLVMELGDSTIAVYSFEIAAKLKERFHVSHEKCLVSKDMKDVHQFEVKEGAIIQEVLGIKPQIYSDRLALPLVSAIPEFRPVYDFLTSMRCYSIVPSLLREPQDPDPGDFLKRDGSNAASVLKRLQDQDTKDSDEYKRLCRLLSKIVPGLKNVEYRAMGQKETMQFRQEIGGQKFPWSFEALNMSDGTLRVLGVLLAVYQPTRPSLIAIEEPEATVHPAVAELVMDVLFEGARRSQVLLTTHSPDILDNKELNDEQIRFVLSDKGKTIICPVAQETRDAIREKLYTPGELLRIDEILPDTKAVEIAEKQLNLFRSLRDQF